MDLVHPRSCELNSKHGCRIPFCHSRDQLIQQLEKSQDMLMNFQQELNVTEQELQRQREENKR